MLGSFRVRGCAAPLQSCTLNAAAISGSALRLVEETRPNGSKGPRPDYEINLFTIARCCLRRGTVLCRRGLQIGLSAPASRRFAERDRLLMCRQLHSIAGAVFTDFLSSLSSL
jgi:hypothetical protein